MSGRVLQVTEDELRMFALDLALDGNAFGVVYEKDGAERLDRIDPREMGIVAGEHNEAKGYLWRGSAGDVAFGSEEVVHLKGALDRDNPWLGKPLGGDK